MASIDENERKSIAIDMLNGERYSVAKYKTEERAKEVLKEIQMTYSIFQVTKNVNESDKEMAFELAKANFKDFDIYEMPKE